MPWETPSLKQVRILTRDFIVARMGSRPMVPNSLMRYLSDSNAGLAHLVLIYVDWLSKQLMPDTAESEWLDRFASIWLTVPRKDATYAGGTVLFTGEYGTVIPSGAILNSQAGDVSYQLTSDVTIGNGETAGPVVSLSAGSLANIAQGEYISLAQSLTGAASAAKVQSISGGFERESDDSLRDRILTRIRKTPMGGAQRDYIAWAREVPGVTRAWANMEAGLGTVTLRFMMDDDRASGLPLGPDVAAVLNHVDPLRPVSVKDFHVLAPIPYRMNVMIHRLSPNTPSVRAAVEASIAKMFIRRATPGGPIYRGWIGEAVSNSAGEDTHELVFQTMQMQNPGQLPIFDGVIWR